MSRKFTNDDAGVTEVIGYILTFALSAIILLISVQSFTVARENSDAVTTAVELKTIASRVANHVVEAGLISQEFPNATYDVTINVPQEINGHGYTIEATGAAIIVATTDGTARAEATTFRLDAISNVAVSGTAYSSNEIVRITYSLSGATKNIQIQG